MCSAQALKVELLGLLGPRWQGLCTNSLRWSVRWEVTGLGKFPELLGDYSFRVWVNLAAGRWTVGSATETCDCYRRFVTWEG